MRALVLVALGACVDGAREPTFEPGEVRIAEAGYALPDCTGYCEHHLTLPRPGVARLRSLWTGDPTPDRVAEGELTDEASTELRVLAAELDALDLEDATFDCPTCEDGGRAFVGLRVDDEVTGPTWERGFPPPVLETTEAILFDDIARALLRCEPTARVTPIACSPP